MLWQAPVRPSHVADVDLNTLLPRLSVAERRKPGRAARSATARIDDEISAHYLRAMTASGLNANTHHAAPVTIDHDLECFASLPQLDIGKLQQPAPHTSLQHRAAYRQPDEF